MVFDKKEKQNKDKFGFEKPEQKKISSSDDGYSFKNIVTSVFKIMFVLAWIGLSITAGYLCWHASVLDTMLIKIFKTFFASVFNIPYLIYYFIKMFLRSNFVKKQTQNARILSNIAKQQTLNYVKNNALAK